MTQYNTLNAKLSNSKNKTEVTINLPSNVIGNSNDETNFPHKLLLTDTQVSKIRQAFANGSSANIKFSKTQLSKMIQLGGFIFGSPYLWDSSNIRFKGLLSSAKSISNSIVKTVNNVDPVDAGLSLLVKKKNY